MWCPQVLLVVLLVVSHARSDQILSLPGLKDTLDFKQYSGYVQIQTRNLFYWFVESRGNAKNDPVTLWLNGGPGCSSLDGFLSENGPFILHPDQTLTLNPHSWNRVANMLYLEAPCGVGYSFSNNPADYNSSDEKTASDNYQFLLHFFQNEFPQYAGNDFYISGESYAGHYIPQLAQKIMQGNQAGNFFINLKGTMSGNPSTSGKYDGWNSFIPFLFQHALIGISEYNKAQSTCQNNWSNNSPACQAAIQKILDDLGDINPYDVYAKCIGKPSVDGYCFTNQQRLASLSNSVLTNINSNKGNVGGQTYVPCMNITLETVYLNRADVKKAIHVSPQANEWEMCSTILNYAWGPDDDMVPIYNQLVKQYRVLFYSGDVDSCVPYLGTQMAAASVQVTGNSTSWHAWFVDKQVAGYTVQFGDNLWYLTVKGAGHMVPQFKPAEAFAFFSRFLAGKPF